MNTVTKKDEPKSMATLLYDAFPQVNLTGDLGDLAQRMEVSRVSTDKNMSELRIALVCDRLVPWSRMRALESEIGDQLFPDKKLPVKIRERFSLSEQYTLSNLLEAYRSSIFDEFWEYSLLEYNLLRSAVFDCPDDRSLTVTFEDSLAAHQKEEEIYNILDKIINERCGMQAAIEIRFTEPAARDRNASEKAFAKEAAEIMRRSESAAAEKTGGNSSGSDELAEIDQDIEIPWEADDAGRSDSKITPKDQSKGTKKQGSQNTNGSRKSAPRSGRSKNTRSRSNNPDIIRGRDFEADPISIDQIVDETGEVVIRGKVIGLDEHEIRGEKTILKFVVTDETDSITVKIFCSNDELPDIKKEIYVGAFLMIHGMTSIDNYDHEITLGSILGIKKIAPFLTERADDSPV